jgi:hypothetical protein
VRSHGDLTPIETVVIVPFENLAERYEPDTGVRSPISGRVFVTGPAAAGADRFMTELLVSRVRRDTAFAILPAGDPAAVVEDFGNGRRGDGKQLERLSQYGRRLGADAVFAGHVYRFRERVGGSFSAESPASVAFDIYLIDCRQSSVLWSAVFDYTQEALSDNLFGMGNFFRRGGRWVTAEELATAAMDPILEDFPRRRMPPQSGIDSGSALRFYQGHGKHPSRTDERHNVEANIRLDISQNRWPGNHLTCVGKDRDLLDNAKTR